MARTIVLAALSGKPEPEDLFKEISARLLAVEVEPWMAVKQKAPAARA